MSTQAVQIQDAEGNVYLPQTSVENVDGAMPNRVAVGNGGHVRYPAGGTYSASGTVTGMLVITLPSDLKNNAFSFWVDAIDTGYTDARHFSMFIYGIATDYAGSYWDKIKAQAIGSSGQSVKTYYQDGLLHISIGEAEDTWESPIILVRDLLSSAALSDSSTCAIKIAQEQAGATGTNCTA